MKVKAGPVYTHYKLFDRYGILLYTGMTSGLKHRLKQHKQDKHWWCYVSTIETTKNLTYFESWLAERNCIVTDKPVFNRPIE